MQSLNRNYFQPNGFFSQSPKPTFSAQFHKNLQFHPKSHSTLHSIQSPNLPPHSLQLPIQFSSTPLKHLIKTTSQKLAIFLVGGLIFMGSFHCKSSLAVEKASVSETMEEIKDTQSENSEDSEEEMYVRMLEENPRDVQALKVVLSKMMTKGNTREAVKYVERLIEIEPDVVEWRLLQALTYEMMGALSKAKRLFKEILVEKPLLLRALHGLAMVMHKNKEGRAVFEMLNKALELAQREKRVTEERNIRILIAQMHVIKVWDRHLTLGAETRIDAFRTKNMKLTEGLVVGGTILPDSHPLVSNKKRRLLDSGASSSAGPNNASFSRMESSITTLTNLVTNMGLSLNARFDTLDANYLSFKQESIDRMDVLENKVKEVKSSVDALSGEFTLMRADVKAWWEEDDMPEEKVVEEEDDLFAPRDSTVAGSMDATKKDLQSS